MGGSFGGHRWPASVYSRRGDPAAARSRSGLRAVSSRLRNDSDCDVRYAPHPQGARQPAGQHPPRGQLPIHGRGDRSTSGGRIKAVRFRLGSPNSRDSQTVLSTRKAASLPAGSIEPISIERNSLSEEPALMGTTSRTCGASGQSPDDERSLSRVSPNACERKEKVQRCAGSRRKKRVWPTCHASAMRADSLRWGTASFQTRGRDPHRHVPERNAMIGSVRDARRAGR
jgi:hypothetical protein